MLRELSMHSVIPPGVTEFAVKALQNLKDAHDSIIESRVFQTHHSNKHRMDEPLIKQGNLVYFSTKNLTLPAGHACKLVPKFIGPFPVARVNSRTSNYTLELSDKLKCRRVHPTFHISVLRPYCPSPDDLFSNWVNFNDVALHAPPETEWLVEEITSHFWNVEGNLWSLGDKMDEPLADVSQLCHQDDYLQLQGVQEPRELPRHSRRGENCQNSCNCQN
jgi:hypothetical protein